MCSRRSVRVSLLFVFAQLVVLHSVAESRVPGAPTAVRADADADGISLWWGPPENAHEVMVRGYAIGYGYGTAELKMAVDGVHANSFRLELLRKAAHAHAQRPNPCDLGSTGS